MKKIYTVLALALISGSIVAQTKEGVKFGIKGGANIASILASSEIKSAMSGSITTFAIGGYASIPVSNGVSIQPNLTYNGKGSLDGEPGRQVTLNIMYLEFPVNAVFKFDDFYIGAGPYAAYALSGKYKAVNNGVTSKADVQFGNNTNELKRMDFGANALAGYQLKNGLNFGFNYGLGLSNVINPGNTELKLRQRVFSVLFGFLF